MNHRTPLPVRAAALLLASSIVLAGCRSGDGSSTRVSLPQSFRLSQSQLSSFFEVRSGRIAIVRDDGNVVLTDQTGEKIVPLTDDAGGGMQRDQDVFVSTRYVFPLWSPDAQQLALVELRAAQPFTSQVRFDGSMTVLVEADPGTRLAEQTPFGTSGRRIEESERFGFQPRRVTIEYGGSHVSSAVYTVSPAGPGPLKEVWYSEDPVEFADWSPRGDALAVLTNGESRDAVTVIGKNDGQRRAVARGSDLRWNWRPDGAALLLRTDAGLTVRSAETGESEKVLEDATASSFEYSPKGDSMVIARMNDGETTLTLADAEGVSQRTLATVRGEVRFAWSPKGDAVAYVVRENGRLAGPLRVVKAAGGEPQLLSTSPVVGFFWSPDGTRIAVFSPLELNGIAEGDDTPSAVSESSTNPMVLQTIEVAQGSAGTRKVLYVEPSARFLAVLVDFDRYARSMTIWSPNSRRLVVPFTVGVGEGGSVDYVAETEASGSIWPRVLGEGSLAVWSPR